MYSKMWIYITYNALDTLILVEVKKMSSMTAGMWTQCSRLSWSGSNFQTVGLATENSRRPSVLRRWRGRRSGNDVQNVVADDWRCLRLERSSLPDTAALCCGDTGGMFRQVCTESGLQQCKSELWYDIYASRLFVRFKTDLKSQS